MNHPDGLPPASDSRTPTAINPYAPIGQDGPVEISELNHSGRQYQLASLPWTFARWLFVCSISAAPSFFAGFLIAEQKTVGMFAGILLFVVSYTAIDYITSEKAWRRDKAIRRTFQIAYGTRIVISIIFPLGFAADVYCFGGAMFLTQAITGQQLTALIYGDTASAFFTTVFQGCVLNVVLGVYGLIVFGICKAFEGGGSSD